MLANKSRIRMGLALFVLVLSVLSCNSPVSPANTPPVTNSIQATSQTNGAPMDTATVPLVPTDTPTASPTLFPRLYAKAISAGFSQSCAITLSGGLKCWGDYLGKNPPFEPADTDHTYPRFIPELESGVKAVSSYDENFSCLLMESGGVKCWGSNLDGQLGDDRASGDFSYLPVDVKGLSSGVIDITVGMFHACALLDTGAVKCWGTNGASVLGNNTYWASKVPTDVIGLSSGVIDIEAGSMHTCALMRTGGVKCWGAQGYGPSLGSGFDGVHNPPYSVVDVKGLSSGAVAIAVGKDFTCVLMEDGGVKCWGLRDYLGDGTNVDHPTPVDVIGLDLPAVAIASGQYSICALLENGSIKCWGFNIAYHQSKDHVFYIPTLIEEFSKKIISVSVGLSHACAIMGDNTVMCWGQNRFGQLGVGSKQSPLPPSDVLCPDCGGSLDGTG